MARKTRPAPRRRAPPPTARPVGAATVATPGVKTPADLKIDTLVQQAAALFYAQEFAKARAALTQILKLQPDRYDALCVLGQVMGRGYEDFEAARDAFTRAQAARPGHSRARVLMAELLSQNGMAEEAKAEALAILEDDPKAVAAFRLIAELDAEDVDDAMLARMIDLGGGETIDPMNRRRLLAALGRVHEKRRDFDAAFGFFSRANALDQGHYDPAALDATIADLRARLTPEFFAERRGFGVKDARNVFVVGMPRSGSTLVEQVAQAHPRVDSCGESNAMLQIERFLRGRMASADSMATRVDFLSRIGKPDAQMAANRYFKTIDIHLATKNPLRILNKSLVNFERLPLLHLLFPNARIIHTFRQPMDMLASCHNQDFLATFFASRVESLAHFFDYYTQMMELMIERLPGRIIHVCHEDFVTDFEDKAPKLIDALDLEWDEACGRPHEKTGIVYTASSAQVRKPVNTSSFGRWRNYEKHFGPLIDALGGLEKIEAGYERMRALSI